MHGHHRNFPPLLLTARACDCIPRSYVFHDYAMPVLGPPLIVGVQHVGRYLPEGLVLVAVLLGACVVILLFAGVCISPYLPISPTYLPTRLAA